MSDPNKHEAAEHKSEDGPLKGWSAADVQPDELSDNDYAAQFPEVSTDGGTDAR